MKTVVRCFFWSILCLVLIIGGDQLLCRFSPQHPSLQVMQKFYTDFRGRLLGLFQPHSIEAVIEKQHQPSPSQPSSPAGSTRFLYKDADGQLQFADSLEQVPPPYRAEAKPMYP